MNIKLPSWLIYILYGVAGIAGVIYGIGWAENIFVFYTWVSIVITPIMLVLLVPEIAEKVLPKIKETYTPGKRAFSLIFSTGVLCLLAASGHFVTAFFYFLVILVWTAIYNEAQKAGPSINA